MEQPTITTAAFAAKLKDARHRKDQLSGERFSEGELDLSRNIDLALQRLQRDLVALDGADTVAPDGASSSAELGRRVVVASSLLVLDTRFASDIDRPLRLLESCALNITRAFGKDFNPMLQLLGLEPLSMKMRSPRLQMEIRHCTPTRLTRELRAVVSICAGL